MKLKALRKFGGIVASLWLCVLAITGSWVKSSTPFAYADSSTGVTEYDKTSIEDDLRDMDISLFPYIKNGSPRVIRFSEYGYSNSPFLKGYYGLYFYVYNPSQEAITQEGNVANMGISYSADGKKVTEYKNQDLILLDKTDGAMENRFFKFKVKDRASYFALADSYAKSYGGERRYDVAGIQLHWANTELEKEMDYAFGATYYFSGFSAGCGSNSNASSTLTSRVDTLETIELDVGHTYFRTHDYKNFVCDELNTVYFSIEDRYYKEYGGLQKIKAQWDEYKSGKILVTEDVEAYNALYPYIGKDIGGSRLDALRWRVMWGETKNEQIAGSPYHYYTYHGAFNPNIDGNGQGTVAEGDSSILPDGGVFNWGGAANIYTRFDYLLKYDPKLLGDGGYIRITSDEMLKYMREYTAAHPEQATVGTLKESFAEGLFRAPIDSDRLELLDARKDGSNPNAKCGRITQEIDAGDTGTFLLSKPQSFWDKFFLRDKEYYGESYSPIVEVTDSILGLTPEAFGKQYFINQSDASTVYDYCKTELAKGNHPILFRFAQTDYYSASARFDCEDDTLISATDGFVAQETMFLGFDIISLTFANVDQEETVIPVVADPIDIINAIEGYTGTSPRDSFNIILFTVITLGSVVVAAFLSKWVKDITE